MGHILQCHALVHTHGVCPTACGGTVAATPLLARIRCAHFLDAFALLHLVAAGHLVLVLLGGLLLEVVLPLFQAVRIGADRQKTVIRNGTIEASTVLFHLLRIWWRLVGGITRRHGVTSDSFQG